MRPESHVPPRPGSDCDAHAKLHDAVRQARSPDDDLVRYLLSTYEAAADLGRWDRAGLERPKADVIVGR